MTINDADFMLELKNYPETRMFAIASNDEIKREDHLKWLENNLQYFKIIEVMIEGDYKPAGVIRIQDNEISIWIHRSFWGRGIATWVLETVSEKGMTAKIVNGNISSMRAFINAGFKPVSYNGKYYTYIK